MKFLACFVVTVAYFVVIAESATIIRPESSTPNPENNSDASPSTFPVDDPVSPSTFGPNLLSTDFSIPPDEDVDSDYLPPDMQPDPFPFYELDYFDEEEDEFDPYADFIVEDVRAAVEPVDNVE
ncbi:hypothetical protein DAPPUDRAFT_98745 [Daphnia pulex]|uniref:Uncharacterized protein n=1 Tax=Daphnia pulex TaxID=6669 RepID=E9G5Q6_DAPPU|nr:hypothetical protein DAPPUDRAFT_98745 [Daphnia pulex]|eukprot:EFX85251.1 hypothetical protein DAPPUDRAFT_98745 [Daphnia pulex]